MSTIIRNLGIDLGSSGTTVVGYTAGGKEALLFRDTVEGRDYFETALATKHIPSDTPEGEKATLAAQLLGNGDSGDVFFIGHGGTFFYDKLKEGLLTEPDTDRSRAYLRAYLRYILEAISESGSYDFSEVESICFGYPAYDHAGSTSSYIATISNILTDTFARRDGRSIQRFSLPEPILAATSYLHANPNAVKPGSLLLVVDCGGYSIDLALVEVCRDGDLVYPKEKVPAISVDGGYTLALGKAMTADILSLVYEKLELDEACPFYDRGVEAAKRAFFSAYEKNARHAEDMAITHLGRHFFLSCGKPHPSEDEVDLSTEMGIDHAFETIACHVLDYLRKLKGEGIITDGHAIGGILMTGGAARMKPLRDAIVSQVRSKLQRFNGAILLTDEGKGNAALLKTADSSAPADLSSDTAVALGAALIAKSPRLLQKISCRVIARDPIAKSTMELEQANEQLYRLRMARLGIEERLTSWVEQLTAAEGGRGSFSVSPADLTGLLQEFLPKIGNADENK